jgi:site-specific recombinase XerD
MKAARAGLVTTRFRTAKRSSTVGFDEGRVSRHIKPLLGYEPVAKLTRSDVQRMADAIAEGRTAGVIKTKMRGKAVITGGAGTAARVVGLLGGIWTWAGKRGLVSGINPAHGVEKTGGTPKDRVLLSDELTALGKTLRASADTQPAATAAVRLIALTGLRRQEACGLRWSEYDEIGHCLKLAATKTGRSMRPLGRAAEALLHSIERGHSDWLFPNKTGRKSADLKKKIEGLFDAAGLKDARSHDLRRTFATTAADEEYSDATIAELLGHAKRGVTAKHYIRRPDGALLAAADRVATRIAAALDDEDEAAELVRLRRRA